MPKVKKFKLKWDLQLVLLLSFVLSAVIAAGTDIKWLHYVRVLLGLPFVLFFPGYVLIAALFPKKGDLDGTERVALSFGLSIAVVPLIGLVLNYTPWGIRLVPILVSLIFFIVALAGLAFWRRKRLPDEGRYVPEFEFSFPEPGEMSALDKVLAGILVVAVIFAVGSLAYVVAEPKVGERFTEFYILGMSGKAENYPRDLAVGEKGQVIVGIVNHEYSSERYYVRCKAGGRDLLKLGPIPLEHEKKWEKPVSFVLEHPGENVKVEFLLYREGDKKPYRSLHLWVNVQPYGAAGNEVKSSLAHGS